MGTIRVRLHAWRLRDHPSQGTTVFLFETEIMWDTELLCQPLDSCPLCDSAQVAITTVLEHCRGLWDTPLAL